jgi:hypothetical protein
VIATHGILGVKRRLQKVYPSATELGSTIAGVYMRAGRSDGRGAAVAGPEMVLDAIGRDNVVRGASGLVCVMGIDELETDANNSEVTVT